MIQGFKCPLDGGHSRLEDCAACDLRCTELPILASLLGDRKVTPFRFSTTQLLKPTKAVILDRSHETWVRPLSLLWATWGTSFHDVVTRTSATLESLGADQFEFEKNFEVTLEVDGTPVVFTGTSDQYDHREHVLVDYKTLPKRSLDRLLEGDWSNGYHWQLNIYRRYMYPDCQSMRLVIPIRDWKPYFAKIGYQEIMRVEVPWIDNQDVDHFVMDRLGSLVAGTIDPSTLPDCTDGETWKGARCRQYCDAAPWCEQAISRGDFKPVEEDME